MLVKTVLELNLFWGFKTTFFFRIEFVLGVLKLIFVLELRLFWRFKTTFCFKIEIVLAF